MFPSQSHRDGLIFDKQQMTRGEIVFDAWDKDEFLTQEWSFQRRFGQNDVVLYCE